jgi:hypothetical protein
MNEGDSQLRRLTVKPGANHFFSIATAKI